MDAGRAEWHFDASARGQGLFLRVGVFARDTGADEGCWLAMHRLAGDAARVCDLFDDMCGRDGELTAVLATSTDQPMSAPIESEGAQCAQESAGGLSSLSIDWGLGHSAPFADVASGMTPPPLGSLSGAAAATAARRAGTARIGSSEVQAMLDAIAAWASDPSALVDGTGDGGKEGAPRGLQQGLDWVAAVAESGPAGRKVLVDAAAPAHLARAILTDDLDAAAGGCACRVALACLGSLLADTDAGTHEAAREQVIAAARDTGVLAHHGDAGAASEHHLFAKACVHEPALAAELDAMLR
mmetsp:Transcript_95474/g.265165  ORF Transcript_95474/g.265165 Transcript_95474/m.265165 type:complete len:299 (+) Transcript_95474:3-899(+)